jgi:AcrR family transcriptional regulator
LSSTPAASPKGADDSLRSRKKAKTHRAIENAALELFAEQGYDATTLEQIADRAQVSITTIYRFFPSKAHVLLGDRAAEASVLRAIADGPANESDFDLVWHAVRDHWVTRIDTQRMSLHARAVARSHVLRGIYDDSVTSWIRDVAAVLAQRRHLDAPDRRCWLVARVCASVIAASQEAWVETDGSRDFAQMVDEGFDLLRSACRDWLSADLPVAHVSEAIDH